MTKWIEHIDNGDGTPICDKGKSNRDIVNDIMCSVDEDVICKECIKEVSRLVRSDFNSFICNISSSKEFRLFKIRDDKY